MSCLTDLSLHLRETVADLVCNPYVLDIYEQELRIWKSLSLKSDSPMRNTLSTDSYSKCVVSSIESVTDDVILFTISFEDNNTVCNLFPGAHIILRASSVDETYSLTRQILQSVR